MTRLAVALIALAAVITAAYLTGRLIEKHHLAAEYRQLRATIADQHAALIAIPPEAYEHRQLVAAEYRARVQASLDRSDAYFIDLRGAA